MVKFAPLGNRVTEYLVVASERLLEFILWAHYTMEVRSKGNQ